MTVPIHPARRIPFGQLRRGVENAVAAKRVSVRYLGDHALYCYTPSAVYDRAWDEITTLARGLIIDWRRERVVATPFPKFFNIGERADEPIPDLPFEVFEKHDGSLIILWHDGERWRTATKGSLDSDQSRAAAAWLADRDLSSLLPGFTYLAEWVGPSNRIVVPYEREELILLAVYDNEGHEYNSILVRQAADVLGWRCVERHLFESLSDLVEHASTLPHTREGFVVRFTDGRRLKIKGDEYRRIHALISRCTPLGVWEALMAGDDIAALRQHLPDEFLGDLDQINVLLSQRVAAIADDVASAAARVAGWSDKEVGLHLPNLSEHSARRIMRQRPARRRRSECRDAARVQPRRLHRPGARRGAVSRRRRALTMPAAGSPDLNRLPRCRRAAAFDIALGALDAIRREAEPAARACAARALGISAGRTLWPRAGTPLCCKE